MKAKELLALNLDEIKIVYGEFELEGKTVRFELESPKSPEKRLLNMVFDYATNEKILNLLSNVEVEGIESYDNAIGLYIEGTLTGLFKLMVAHATLKDFGYTLNSVEIPKNE